MEFIFGWAASTINGWVDGITKYIFCGEVLPRWLHNGVLSPKIKAVHDLFLRFRSFPSAQEQACMAIEHTTFLLKKSSEYGSDLLAGYGKRLLYDATTFAHLAFNGAIGAIDGTFTLCCRFPDDIQELMYTGYKKFHAYKLVIVCSLFTKAILAILIVPATEADSMAWTMDFTFASQLASGLFLLGDAAFNGIADIIPPYRTESINITQRVNPEAAAEMRAFNQVRRVVHMSYI
jgi:hypothetical protein